MTKEKAYNLGKRYAYGITPFALEELSKLESSRRLSDEELEIKFWVIFSEIDENNRQYGPFESIAYKLNKSDYPEDAWHNFEEGNFDQARALFNEWMQTRQED
jgi:hypothetical protein